MASLLQEAVSLAEPMKTKTFEAEGNPSDGRLIRPRGAAVNVNLGRNGNPALKAKDLNLGASFEACGAAVLDGTSEPPLIARPAYPAALKASRAGTRPKPIGDKIGRASCRERV